MKTRIVDSWPVVEWMYGREPATAYVQELLTKATEGNLRLLMSAINVGEVFYVVSKRGGEALGAAWRAMSDDLPVEVEAPSVDDIWRAAELKAAYPISHADAFAALLAQKYECPLVTGDREFRAVRGLELEWLITH